MPGCLADVWEKKPERKQFRRDEMETEDQDEIKYEPYQVIEMQGRAADVNPVVNKSRCGGWRETTKKMTGKAADERVGAKQIYFSRGKMTRQGSAGSFGLMRRRATSA